MIARFLPSLDVFDLAMTSKKTFERLKLLKLLNCSAADRYILSNPGKKLKSLNLSPLVAEMLSNAFPAEKLAPIVEKRSACTLLFHQATSTFLVQCFANLFEMRGFEVHLKRVDFVSKSGGPTLQDPASCNFCPVEKDTPDGLFEKLKACKTLPEHQRPDEHSIKMRGIVIANKGVGLLALHADLCLRLMRESDALLVDLCFADSMVWPISRAFGMDLKLLRSKYMNCARHNFEIETVQFANWTPLKPVYPTFEEVAVECRRLCTSGKNVLGVFQFARARRRLYMLCRTGTNNQMFRFLLLFFSPPFITCSFVSSSDLHIRSTAEQSDSKLVSTFASHENPW